MNKYGKLICVVLGIILTACALKVFQEAFDKNYPMYYKVVKGSYAEEHYKEIDEKKVVSVEKEELPLEGKYTQKFEYHELEDGTLEVTKFTGNTYVVVIPETINDKKVSVVSIDQTFRSVVVPDSVTKINGDIKLTTATCEYQLTVIMVFIAVILVYTTVIITATKKFDIKVATLSFIYVLIPIVYTLSTNMYLRPLSTYNYTYMGLMLVTTIFYIIVAAIMVGYTKDIEETKKTRRTTTKASAPAKKAPAKKTAAKTTTKKTTTKKAPAKKKTTKK